MAEQADRKLKRKKIKIKKSDDSDGESVDVPVIYDATFVTAADQYQEGHLFFKNDSGDTSRKVHTQRVTNQDTNDYVDVERIDSFFTKTAADQYQETEWPLKNKDPPPIQPDGTDNPAHQKKHVVRFFKNNDKNSKTWVDIEQIDQLNAILPQEQYQEYQLYMRNAEIGDSVDNSGVPYDVTVGFCDPDLDQADDYDSDPPYRIDPLQNIVNVHSHEGTTGTGVTTGADEIAVLVFAFYRGLANSGNEFGCSPPDCFSGPPGPGDCPVNQSFYQTSSAFSSAYFDPESGNEVTSSAEGPSGPGVSPTVVGASATAAGGSVTLTVQLASQGGALCAAVWLTSLIIYPIAGETGHSFTSLALPGSFTKGGKTYNLDHLGSVSATWSNFPSEANAVAQYIYTAATH
jgi:hypothetical protein